MYHSLRIPRGGQKVRRDLNRPFILIRDRKVMLLWEEATGTMMKKMVTIRNEEEGEIRNQEEEEKEMLIIRKIEKWVVIQVLEELGSSDRS